MQLSLHVDIDPHAGRKDSVFCRALIFSVLLKDESVALIWFMQWFPEVKHFCREVPVILIGCKTDLRKDKECARKLKAMNQVPITYTQVRLQEVCKHLVSY